MCECGMNKSIFISVTHGWQLRSVCGCCSFLFLTLWLQLWFVFLTNTETVPSSTCCWSTFSSCCLMHLVTFCGAKINFWGPEENCFIALTYTNISNHPQVFFLVSLAIITLSNHDHFPKENKSRVYLLLSYCGTHFLLIISSLTNVTLFSSSYVLLHDTPGTMCARR